MVSSLGSQACFFVILLCIILLLVYAFIVCLYSSTLAFFQLFLFNVDPDSVVMTQCLQLSSCRHCLSDFPCFRLLQPSPLLRRMFDSLPTGFTSFHRPCPYCLLIPSWTLCRHLIQMVGLCAVDPELLLSIGLLMGV